MKLVVDGLIFQKDPHGGIARLFREVLPRMCIIETGLSITLFIDGPVRAELPTHAQIKLRRMPAVRHTLRPRGVARRLLYPMRRLASRAWNVARQIWLVEGQDAIWHSTYYTQPVTWRGSQVVSVYDMIQELYQQEYNDPLEELGRQQKRRCLESASAVICISEATKRDLLQLYPLDPALVSVIPLASGNAFHLLSDEQMQIPGLSERPFALFVGSRFFYKNFSGLLDFYRNWEGKSKLDLLVVGPPWSVEEEQTLKRFGLEERVRLMSDIDDKTLCMLYNLAQAFIFPSLVEGFGIPLLEAMACGCPVIASSIPSTLEVAGDCPYYFDLAKPATWLSAFEQALSYGRESPRVQAGLQRVKQYSWDNTARGMLEVYRKVSPTSSNPSGR